MLPAKAEDIKMFRFIRSSPIAQRAGNASPFREYADGATGSRRNSFGSATLTKLNQRNHFAFGNIDESQFRRGFVCGERIRGNFGRLLKMLAVDKQMSLLLVRATPRIRPILPQ
jgi:hypothetical protein